MSINIDDLMLEFYNHIKDGKFSAIIKYKNINNYENTNWCHYRYNIKSELHHMEITMNKLYKTDDVLTNDIIKLTVMFLDWYFNKVNSSMLIGVLNTNSYDNIYNQSRWYDEVLRNYLFIDKINNLLKSILDNILLYKDDKSIYQNILPKTNIILSLFILNIFLPPMEFYIKNLDNCKQFGGSSNIKEILLSDVYSFVSKLINDIRSGNESSSEQSIDLIKKCIELIQPFVYYFEELSDDLRTGRIKIISKYSDRSLIQSFDNIIDK